MKMAKASEADLEMALKLANYLGDLERDQMPIDLSNDEELGEWIDTNSPEQYERLFLGLKRLLNQGSIFRVIFGMAVVCDPQNKCLDPASDIIEPHPETVNAYETRDELLAALKACESALRYVESESGRIYAATVNARAVIASTGAA